MQRTLHLTLVPATKGFYLSFIYLSLYISGNETRISHLAQYSLVLYSTQRVSASDSRFVQSYQDLNSTLAHNINGGLAHEESCCLGHFSCQGWTQPLCYKQGSLSYNSLPLSKISFSSPPLTSCFV